MSSSHNIHCIKLDDGRFRSVTEEQLDLFLSNYVEVDLENEEIPDEFTVITNYFDQAGNRIAYSMFWIEFTDEELDIMEMRLTRQLRMAEPFKYTEEQRIAYKTFGGTPHLDGQYTVFGEVVEGFDVLQKISEVETGRSDRPVEDIRIINMKIVKR